MRSVKKSFTLLELIITIVIFTAGVMAILWLFAGSLAAGTDAENTLIAINLGRQRIEEIRNLGFSNITNETKAQVSGFSGFQRQVDVSQPLTDLKQVAVTVFWTGKGGEVSEDLVTYISRN